MTDKEKRIFEEWFEEKKEKCEVYGNGDDFWVDDEIKKFCLMGYELGLKAGRPQWHKADVPTNPINKEVLGCIKDYNSKKFCLVKWNGEWWYDTRTWNDKVKLIAWCEIPTFDKE